jgi:hypothetical protein
MKNFSKDLLLTRNVKKVTLAALCIIVASFVLLSSPQNKTALSAFTQNDWSGNQFSQIDNLDPSVPGALSLAGSNVSNWCNTGNCDSSWTRRQLITINNPTGNTITNAQIKLNVIHRNSMKPGFDDIRFTTSDGLSDINYYIFNKVDSTSAEVFVRVPTLAPGVQNIEMFYGNTNADSLSDGSSTVNFVDNFARDTSSASLITEWASPGPGTNELQQPKDIAIGNGNTVYVTDSLNSRVVAYDDSGTQILVIGQYGTSDGEFIEPSGIAINSTNGDIYVTDQGRNNVQVFDSLGVFKSSFGVSGSSTGEMSNPIGIAVCETSVYVVDNGNSRVQWWDLSGNNIGSQGGLGSALGEFNDPRGVHADQNNSCTLSVADYGNNRIVHMASDLGVYAGINNPYSDTFGQGELNNPTDVIRDNQGNYYISDGGNGKIRKYNLRGGLQYSWNDSTAAVALDTNNKLYSVDYTNSKVSKFDVPTLSGWQHQQGEDYSSNASGEVTVNPNKNIVTTGTFDRSVNRVYEVSRKANLATLDCGGNGVGGITSSGDGENGDSTINFYGGCLDGQTKQYRRNNITIQGNSYYGGSPDVILSDGQYIRVRIIAYASGGSDFFFSMDEGQTYTKFTEYPLGNDTGNSSLTLWSQSVPITYKNAISYDKLPDSITSYFGIEEFVGGKTGSLVSSILDATENGAYTTLNYQLSGNGNSLVQVRTSNNSNMSGASEWYTCGDLSSGSLVDSSNSCARRSDRYAQYKVTLAQDVGETYYLQDITLNYVIDFTPPASPTNFIIKTSSAGSIVPENSWTRSITPYISWDPSEDPIVPLNDTAGTAGYCVYLGSDNTANPVTARGALVGFGDLNNGLCDFSTTNPYIDLSPGGTPHIDLQSNSTYYVIVKAVDAAGNISATSTQTSFKVDTTLPSVGTTVNVPSASGSKIFNVSWISNFPASASDNESGLAGFKYCLSPIYSGGSGCQTEDPNWYGATHTSGDIHDSTDVIPFSAGGFQTVLADADRLDDSVMGANFVFISAIDFAGNVLQVSAYDVVLILKVAAAAPSNLHVSPSSNSQNDFAFTWGTPSFFLGDTADIDYCWSVNTPIAEDGSNCTWTGKGITQLASGAYATQQGLNTMYIASKDVTGNFNGTQAAAVTFTANTTAPGIPRNLDSSDVSIRATSTWKVALSWNAPTLAGSGVHSYKIFRSTDSITFAQVGTSASSNTSFIDAGLNQVQYYYVIRACDNADNCSAPSSPVSRTPLGRFTEPANLTSNEYPKSKDVSTRKSTVYWYTDRASDSKVAFGTKPGQYNAEEVGNATQTADHSVTITNLSPNTTYYYVAKWTDVDGNLGQSAEKSFTTLPAPTISEVVTTNITINSATVTFRSKDVTKVNIQYGLGDSLGGQKTINTSTKDTSYSVVLDSLNDGTKYTFKLNGVDADGNEYQGNSYSVTTLPRPKISNLRFQPVDGEPSSTMRVTWDTNVLANSVLSYGIRDGKRIEVLGNTLTLNHEILIRDLIDASTYTLTAESTDAGGVQAISDTQTFNTKLDTRAPKISNVSIEVTLKGSGTDSRGQVIVSWKTDEKATSQIAYGIGQSAQLASTNAEDVRLTTEHTVVLSDFSPSTIYRLTPVSRDKANNTSKQNIQTVIVGRGTENIFGIVLNSLQKIFGIKG